VRFIAEIKRMEMDRQIERWLGLMFGAEALYEKTWERIKTYRRLQGEIDNIPVPKGEEDGVLRKTTGLLWTCYESELRQAADELERLMECKRQGAKIFCNIEPAELEILRLRYGERLSWAKVGRKVGFSEKHLFKCRRRMFEVIGGRMGD